MTSLGVPQTSAETPSFAGAVEAVITAKLLEMFTAMPGQVESYNATLGLANIQPGIKRKFIKDNETVNLPIINNVPVVFPRSGQAALTFPLKKGDSVLLVFSQRSLDNWKLAGGVVEAGDPRHHDLSDAFAIPGGYPKVEPLVGVDPDNVVLQNGVANKVTVKSNAVELTTGIGKFTVDNAGKITLGNGSVDLLGLIDQLIDAICKLTVPTGVGPSGIPINKAEFSAIKTQLGLIKG